jgi:hypothetical protein
LKLEYGHEVFAELICEVGHGRFRRADNKKQRYHEQKERNFINRPRKRLLNIGKIGLP